MSHATPIEQRIAQGNPSNRPLPEVVVGLGKIHDLEKPFDLTDREDVAWDECVPQILALGWIDEIDTLVVREYVRLKAMADWAFNELQKGSLISRGAAGGQVTNPMWRVYRDCVSEQRQIGDRLGFNPSARARLGLAKVKGMSLAADLEARLGVADEDVPDEITVEDD